MLDPCEAVKELFLLPDFATARGTARTKDKVGSWWASAHYKDLDMATGGHLDKPEISAYELGFDGAELTIASGKNTYLAFMRYVAGTCVRPWQLWLAQPAVRRGELSQGSPLLASLTADACLLQNATKLSTHMCNVNFSLPLLHAHCCSCRMASAGTCLSTCWASSAIARWCWQCLDPSLRAWTPTWTRWAKSWPS